MAAERIGTVVRRRLLGVLLLALVAALVALSIAVYNKAFTKVVLVKLETDHTGNQLLTHSDVKERGVIVGEVRSISSHGDGATITLALNPGKAKTIDNYQVAQLLPKTLFGERYVSLIVPPDNAAPKPAYCKPTQAPGPVKGGQTMCQDNSAQYAEVQNVLADLMPVLTALKPAELNATLNALATALDGRGKELGQTIDTLDTYLKGINPHVPQLVDDLDKLGKVALEYNDVVPDLFDSLTNLQTTSRTLVQKQAALDDLLRVGSATSTTLTQFLNANAQNLITVTDTSNSIFTLLAEYSPEYGCLLKGLADLDPRLEDAFRDGRLHVTIEIVKGRGKYVPGNEPKLITGRGPHCGGLPNPQVPYTIPPEYQNLNDGAPLVGGPGTGALASPIRGAYGPGSPAETSMINTLIAGDYGTTPNKVPPVATVLAGPLLRGSQVTVK
ncbi:MAG TPA: MCE family protein [Jatrophihabitantaceae bacterium]|jgi:virulence factor Mce-like protein